MKKLFLLISFLLSMNALAGVKAVTPEPQSTDPESWWCKRFQTKCEQLKETGAPLILVGDENMQMWEESGRGLIPFRKYLQKAPVSAVGLGYSGDTTENVLWRLQNGELEGYTPEMALVMVGNNNTMLRSEEEEPPSDTALGIRAIVDTIKERSPETKICVFAILPCGRDSNDPRRTRNAAVNDAVRVLLAGTDVAFYEINNQVMDVDLIFGEDYSYDGIHLNATGYNVWVKNINNIIAPVFPTEVKPDSQIPTTRFGEQWWKDRIYEIRCNTFEGKTGRPNLVFFGDDLAKGWEDQGAEAAKEAFGTRRRLVAGIDGDSLPVLLWRAKNSSLSTYRAGYIVIHAGVVDSELPEDEFVDAFKLIFTEAKGKQSGGKIIVLALPPRGAEPDDPMRARVANINKELAKMVDNNKTFFVDCNDELLDENGRLTEEMSPDAIHFTSKAYEIWAQAIAKIMN